MASLRPLRSTTLEGAFLEIAFLLERGEMLLNAFNKPDDDRKPWHKLTHISIALDTNSQRIVITATIPIKVESNSFGGYLLAREMYSNNTVYLGNFHG